MVAPNNLILLRAPFVVCCFDIGTGNWNVIEMACFSLDVLYVGGRSLAVLFLVGLGKLSLHTASLYCIVEF